MRRVLLCMLEAVGGCDLFAGGARGDVRYAALCMEAVESVLYVLEVVKDARSVL